MKIYTRRSVQSLQRLFSNILRMGRFSICMVLMGLTLAVEAVDQESITSTVGQSVTLPCKAPSNMSVKAVQWDRDGLDDYVLSCRAKNLDTEGQDASYKNRVDLINRQMQNGDLSLLLWNITANDSGTYECRAFYVGPKVLSIIKLDVRQSDGDGAISDAGTEGNHLQLSVLVLVPVVIVILVLVAGIVIGKRKNWINIGAAARCRYEMTSTSP